MKLHVVPARKTTFGQTCKHYDAGERGPTTRPDCCKAGVKYADVTISGEWKYRNERGGGAVYTHGKCSPCHRDYNFGGAAKCDKAEFATEAEIAAWLEESDRRLAHIGVARAAIIAHLGKNKFGSGTIPCPCCNGGTLWFSRSSVNGHVHARCSTADCVSWIE